MEAKVGASNGTKNKPVAHAQCGSVRASVWKNTAKTKGGDKEFYNISFQRSYQDDKGEWQNTDNYGIGDLPKLAAIASELYAKYGIKIEE